ncbi:MAG: NYN domain-containing protein [Caldilineales bacterium]|nr:NYN domain-containing protein [Caldilineales bacterium]
MYLIDGHNLIGAGLIPGIHLAQEDDEQRLVDYLRARRDRLSQSVIVVFDGGLPGGQARELSGGGVQAVFAAQYRGDADAVILGRVRQNPKTCIVVTNDSDLRNRCRAMGAQVLTATEFVGLLNRPPRRRTTGRRTTKEDPRLSEAEIEAWLQLFGEEG